MNDHDIPSWRIVQALQAAERRGGPTRFEWWLGCALWCGGAALLVRVVWGLL